MSEALKRYHEQRDGLVGRSADHLKPPATYTRGAIPPEDRRGRRTILASIVLRIGLATLFFGLWLFVWFYILMDWSK